jgi:hypothetical protein
VLEHLPDLPGELNFLAALLNPGGLLVFDVPAGATKSHPMHLNHDLDVVSYMRARGMTDERTLWQRLPFRKEQKYFFRAPKDVKPALAQTQCRMSAETRPLRVDPLAESGRFGVTQLLGIKVFGPFSPEFIDIFPFRV